MAFKNNNANYTSSVKYAAVTAWATGQAKAVGDLIRQTAPAVNNERIWMCTIAGTTHATTEPTWTTSRGDKIVDNSSVTWVEITGMPAMNGDMASTPNWIDGAKGQNISIGHVIKDAAGTHIFVCTTNGNASGTTEPTWNTSAVGNTTTDSSMTWTYVGTSFGAWAAPHARTRNAMAANWTDPSPLVGPMLYIGSDHAETQSSSISWLTKGTSQFPASIICVDVAGSLPPVSADLRATATVTVTGSSQLAIGAGSYRTCYGISFFCGTSGNENITSNADSADRTYENCTFSLPSGVGSNSQFQFNNTTGKLQFKDCTFLYSNAAQTFTCDNAELDGCVFAPTGSTPTNFFPTNLNTVRAIFRNCDLSTCTNLILMATPTGGRIVIQFLDCKMPSGLSKGSWSVGGTNNENLLTMSRCDASGNTWQYSQQSVAGSVDASATIYRTGGAVDSVTPISWKLVSTTSIFANAGELRPPLLAEYNDAVGSSMTAKIYGIINAAAVPTDADIYLDVDYEGTSGNTVGTRKSTRIPNFLATPTNYTADSTSAWDAGATSRANSHAYSVGDIIKTASNSGRIFFCTVAGTSAGSEPGGYASAVDGGSVTDSGATFRAGCRFSMTATLASPNPTLAGIIYAQVKVAGISKTIFVDPALILA